MYVAGTGLVVASPSLPAGPGTTPIHCSAGGCCSNSLGQTALLGIQLVSLMVPSVPLNIAQEGGEKVEGKRGEINKIKHLLQFKHERITLG